MKISLTDIFACITSCKELCIKQAGLLNIIKMKWNDVYVAVTGEPGGALSALKNRYAIPDNKCINFCEELRAGTVEAYPNCLSSVNLSSKLILLGHGTPSCYSIDGTPYHPIALTRFLAHYGLKKAGLISFKSCHIGAASFFGNFFMHFNTEGNKGWLVKGL